LAQGLRIPPRSSDPPSQCSEPTRVSLLGRVKMEAQLAPRKPGPKHSTGWKTITLQVHASKEQIQLPVMIAAKVADVRLALCETLELDDPFKLEFHCKAGCSIKRMRPSDEVQSLMFVKGLKSFDKPQQEYRHAFVIIGGGAFSMRQSAEWKRQQIADYHIFERKDCLGGNAWVTIANQSSKLQSEGSHYQVMWWPDECETHMLHDFGYWPSRQRIISHFYQIMREQGIWPHIHMQTEVVDTLFMEDEFDAFGRSYTLKLKKTDGTDETGACQCSCLCYYPGCLCVPHRKTWPGEDVFGGQIGYGFSNEFDYRRIYEQYCIMIGMGAFAAENCRTIMEFGGAKVYIIARHFNLLLPRCISWYVNQSSDPPPAAFILDAFVPMYSLLNWDPWKFFSITANSDRTIATIKQYTRWGIGDATFCALYWNRAEIIQGTVKRFKPRAAVLDSGRVIENLDHVIKVIGFDGDFGVDRVNHASYYHGFWPEADFRRWCLSDQSAIDASRFGVTALSPGAASFSWNSTYYFRHPKISMALAKDPYVPKGTPDVELGSPGYHYDPRNGQSVGMIFGSYAEAIRQHEGLVGRWKKGSIWFLCPPEKFVEECRYDWYQYCEMCRARGDLRPFPDYPYDPEYMHGLHQKELEFGAKSMAKYVAMAEQGQQAQDGWLSTQVLESTNGLSLEPMKSVMRARARSTSMDATRDERENWKKEGEGTRQMLMSRCKSPPKNSIANNAIEAFA